MKCTRCRSLFDSAHDGALDQRSPLRAAFDAHLSSCAACSEAWGHWQQAMHALRHAAAGRASLEEAESVVRAVEAATHPTAAAGPAPEAAYHHGLLLAAAQAVAGRRRRAAALFVAAVSGAIAASIAFLLWWPHAPAPAPIVRGSPEPAVAVSEPVTTPPVHVAPPVIVLDTRPLAELLEDLGGRLHRHLFAPSAATGEPPSVGAASRDLAAGTTVTAEPERRDIAPAPEPFGSPRPGEVLLSRADGRLSLTLITAPADDAPDFRALVPPLLQLLSDPDEEVVRLAEARLETLRDQIERLPGLESALEAAHAPEGRRSTPRGWQQLIGLRAAPSPTEPASKRWQRWWELAEPLLPRHEGVTS